MIAVAVETEIGIVVEAVEEVVFVVGRPNSWAKTHIQV